MEWDSFKLDKEYMEYIITICERRNKVRPCSRLFFHASMAASWQNVIIGGIFVLGIVDPNFIH